MARGRAGIAAASGWRKLGLFWACVAVVAAAGAGVLQYLGPPGGRPAQTGPAPELHAAAHAPETAPRPQAAAEHGTASGGATTVTAATAPPPPHAPGTIPAPDPALLEPAPDFRDAKLPRIAADGRASMRVYARPFDRADKRPRVALLVSGLGLSDADSRAAIATLPPAISLGISPYSRDPEPMLAEARAKGHEYFVTLPMESQGYPLNNSGVHALMIERRPG